MKNEPENSRIVKKRGETQTETRRRTDETGEKTERKEKTRQKVEEEPTDDRLPNESVRVFAITLVVVLGLAIGAFVCWLTFQHLPQ